MNGRSGRLAEEFLALLRPLERDLETYARRLLWDSQDVSDAIQNALLRAVAAFARYRRDASFRAWMFKILTNEIHRLNRKRRRQTEHEIPFCQEFVEAMPGPELPPEPGSSLSSADWLAEELEPGLAKALRSLKESERSVLLLRAMADLAYREISEALDMPLGSVMGYLARARGKVRAALLRNPKERGREHELR